MVNLGIGIPTLCSNYKQDDKEVIYHSENGVIGYGAIYPRGEEDRHLVNAGGQYVSLVPGASIIHHADSFAIIRGGMLDLTVMGAYEVAENGDFANWKTQGRRGGGIGGAMDLAVGAKRVFIAMQHTTRDGKPRVLRQCTLPITAKGVVKLLVTDLGLFEVTEAGLPYERNCPRLRARRGAKSLPRPILLCPTVSRRWKYRNMPPSSSLVLDRMSFSNGPLFLPFYRVGWEVLCVAALNTANKLSVRVASQLQVTFTLRAGL